MSLLLLNKQEKVIKIIPQTDLIEVWQNGGINELDVIEGVIKLTPSLKNIIDDVYYYAIDDADDKYSFYLYKAISNKVTNTQISFYGLQSGFDDLKAKGYVKDFRPQNRPVSFVMNTILADTGWELGFVDSRLPNITNTFYYVNKLDALSALIELTGAEIEFKVAITGNQITMKYLDIHYQMGEDNGKRFVYGTNALEIVKEYDTAELYTAIVGRGKGEEKDNGYGRRLTFETIEWKKSNGKPVDKPLGQEFIEIPEATALYGYPDGKPRVFIKEYPEIEDKNELITASYNDLKLLARPKVQFKATVENVGDLKKGDTVTIVRYDLGIAYQTRVFKVQRNRINNKFTKVQLGDVIVQSEAKKNADFTKNINTQLQIIRNQVGNAEIIAADGTKITYGATQPATAKPNDLWYEELANGKVNLRRWNGELWELIVNDMFGEEIRNNVTKIIAQADRDRTKTETDISNAIIAANDYTQLKANEFDADLLIVNNQLGQTITKANEAVTKADKAIEDVGFLKPDVATAKSNAATALSTAQTSFANANTAVTNAQNALNAYNNLEIGGRNLILNGNFYTKSLNGWSNNGGVVYQLLDGKNVAKLGSSNGIYQYLTSPTEGVYTYSFLAKSDTNGISARVGFVNGTYPQTYQNFYLTTNWKRYTYTITTPLTTNQIFHVYSVGTPYYITDIQVEKGNKVSDFSNAPEDVQTQITAINGELASKVTQTVFDTLKGVVTNQGTLITQSQTAIGLKADKTAVDTINQTVEQHTTDIRITSEGLALKADSSFVNTIKGTVDNHATQITANSTAITARLTSAQIETLLTGKQYVNQTTLNATSSGLTAQITQVSTNLSNLEIGGRNLFLNSKGSKVSDYPPTYQINGSKQVFADTTVPSGNFMRIYNFAVTGTSPSFYFTPTSLTYFSENLTGKKIIISFFIRGNVPFLFNDTIQIGTNWTKVSLQYTFSASNQHLYIYDTAVQTVDISSVKVEYGNKSTDWSPSPNDMATLEKVVTIEANIDGINTLVASKASQTQVTQLAGQLTTKVESATYNSKMTQLDSAINLRVVQSDVTAAILADKKIKDTRNDNQSPIWYNNNYAGTSVTEFKTRSVVGVPGIATFVQLETKSPWTGSSGGEIVQIANSSDGTYQRVSIGGLASWGVWDKIAEAGKLISQINISTEGILLQGKRIQLDGDVTMTVAFVSRLDVQTLTAVTANIASIRTQILTANVVDSNMIKSDTALITKIFATDANVQILTAKTAFINSIKTIDLSASKITTGILDASKINVINLTASMITANNLSSLSINTGALNVTDWLTFSTDNKGIRATYDFGDPLNNSFDPRWFLGSYTLGYRYMKFQSDVYTVNSSGGRGNFGYYAESYYGADYFKLRQFRTASNPELLARTDMRAEYFSMSTTYTTSNIYLNANGDTFFSGNMQVGGDLSVMNLKALKAYYIQAPDSAYNVYINGGRNDLGSMRFGVDGSTLNGGRLISSDSIYNRTYSSSANVVVFDTGTIGRVVSAKKYKLNISKLLLLETAKKTLAISPSSWYDKGEVESISKSIDEGKENSLDPNFKIRKHYGFIADEFNDVGALEVVIYGSDGQVEGLAYERISMFHHELIKDLYRQIELQQKKIDEIERKIGE